MLKACVILNITPEVRILNAIKMVLSHRYKTLIM